MENLVLRERRQVTQPSGGKVMTKQAPAESCNINVIVDRWRKSGVLPPGAGEPRYGDFTGVSDYHAALTQISEAEADFGALPARVRKHCRNDAGEFLRMVEDPERVGELVELGLLPERKPVKEPEKAPEPSAGGGPPGSVSGGD